nr:NB-ARC domains-containing protein [Tanacetum cinerariifolium]
MLASIGSDPSIYAPFSIHIFTLFCAFTINQQWLNSFFGVVFEKPTVVRAVLNDASKKEVTDEAVKKGLNGLQHLAYYIDDILDGLATDAAIHYDFTNESEGFTSRVRKLIPTCCINFSLNTRMVRKLNSITTRLQELIDEKNNLGLIVKDGGPKSKNRNYQTSLVDAPSIVGREGNKKELLKKLLGDEACSQNFSIVPIVGRENKEFADLNLLQAALKNQLTGKRFLLVLDDIWSEKLEDWETLAALFF